MSIKERLKILTKIAQQATTPTAPTTTMVPPPGFQASSIFGWLGSVYNTQTVSSLNNLCSTLNIALHYVSNGQFNWQVLRGNGFQVDPSGAPNVDAKNLINLSMLTYQTLLNAGNKPPQQVSPSQIATWVGMLSNSQALMNLSQVNPTGVIAQKIPGNLKDTILTYLKYLTMYNPLV